MKKLLLTTTALAGMTGAAVADVSFSGGANINYKTAEGGNEAVFSSDSNLTATMSNGGAYSASVGIGVGAVGRSFTGSAAARSNVFEALSIVGDGKNTSAIRENIRPIPVVAGSAPEGRGLVLLSGAADVTDLRASACPSRATELNPVSRDGALAI